MKKVIAGFIVCLFLLNCSKKESIKKRQTYIISYEDKKRQEYFDSLAKSKNTTFAFPPKGFYGESQLVIDKDDNLYYYQQNYIGVRCGTGMENDTLPHFLDLQPKDIVRIPKENLNGFLSENILYKDKKRQVLTIASQKDTIKDISFLDFLIKNRLETYVIRRTTQEEDTVLKYKKNNHYYYSDDIKWDQDRITLPFIKPKLNK
ncbi:MAG: hypothetical protein EOO44_02175 [Flavobacterium sp.]|nr:MAG: hypothetical protein EOO44_02175 [Flavobacterium sp.]